METNMPDAAETLSFAGMLLFLLGLFTGFAIPKCRSPRVGLSAHLAAVQSGTFLLALGLLWPKLGLGAPWNGVMANTTWISLYMVWLSLLLAAMFGAGRGLPIAGQGITTTPARQAVVTVLLVAGSLGILVAVGAVLVTWHWRA
jgi:(hydroxyamino)benzene mutase